MPKYRFNKLVRDKYFEDMQNDTSQNTIFRKLDQDEFITEILNKIEEEASELKNFKNEDNLVEELADLYELLDIIKNEMNISEDDIQNAKLQKIKKAGGFDKKIYVESNEVREGSKWDNYYLSSPDKYPRID